ncbi:MAG: hypothetical protein ACP5I4_01430 [Oceanipulchritudo sp.]
MSFRWHSLACILLACLAAEATGWTTLVPVEAAGREGIAHFWKPADADSLKALFLCKDNFAEEELVRDPQLREFLGGPATRTGPSEFTIDHELAGKPGYGRKLRILAVQTGDDTWRHSERLAEATIPQTKKVQ